MLSTSSDHIPHLEQCFQSDYGWNLYELLRDVRQGNANVGDLVSYIETDRSNHPLGYTHVNFLTDASLQRQGEDPNEVFGPAYKAFTAMTFLMDGIPLIYNGQEVGDVSTRPGGASAAIDWDGDEEIQQLFLGLIQLKDYNRALWNGKYGAPMELIGNSDAVFAIQRVKDGHTVVLIANCTGAPAEIKFDTSLRVTSDLFTGEDLIINEGQVMKLDPWEYRIAANPSILIE